jgi:AcrR family transcriptional regulator
VLTPVNQEVVVRADAQVNRERILAAAEEVFATSGAEGSTEDVARRAGVGVGTVFRHFPTKQQLIAATVVRHFELLIAEARELALHDDPGTALRALMETMVNGTATKLALLGLLDDSAPEEVLSASRRLRAAVRGLLQRSQKAGLMRADVSVDELYLLVRGLALATAQGSTRPSTGRKALDVVMAGLTPR